MSIFTYFTKKRREQRRKLKELKAFASRFSTLDRLEQSGLLTFDAKSRRLFIAQSLAVLMMKDAESWVAFVTNVYQWLYYQQAQEAWNAHFLKEELAAVRKAAAGFSPEVLAEGKRQSRARGSQRGSALDEHSEALATNGTQEQADGTATNQTSPNPVDNQTTPPYGHPSYSGGETDTRVQLSRADVERIRLAARQQVAESDIEPPKIEPFEFFIVQDTTDAAAKLIAVGYFNPETNDMELAPWSEVEPLLHQSRQE